MNDDAAELFNDLADLSPAEREDYFARRQVPPDRRAEVESLLRFDAGGDSLTDRVAAAAEQLIRSSATRPDIQCGPYRLVRLLGRGGMGSVYLAKRTDGEVEQRVAIKFLGPGADQPVFRDRFLRERQILASLSHPGIARLLDAGHSGDGQPYLVMDYVDGTPIDAYCEKLDLRGKLALFIRVCEAVSYAHRNLVIHRDLKPSNILVDAAGQPILLDFGIAKILDAAADRTQTRDRLLTPDYASPEQVRGGAQATTTDVYSLGAVLYKLLTGRPPHASTGASREAMETAICSTEPPLASRLSPGLPRDLDFILRKALRKEPEERYPSVEALAGDLRAFLEWRPVRARSGNAWYRTRKFVRRYWVPVAAATLAIAGLSVGLYAANRERAIAQHRFLQLRQLANKFFALDGDLAGVPGTIKARQHIVSTSMEYLEALGAEVRGDNGLALEIAKGYLQMARIEGVPIQPNLGQFAKADQMLAKADAFVESVLRSSPENRAALLASAAIAHDRMILAQSDHRRAEALAYANKASERLEALLGHGDAQPAEIVDASLYYKNIAQAQMNMHRFEDAVRYARRAIDISRSVNAAAGHRGSALSIVANALRQMGDLDGALKAIREARAILEAQSYSDETARAFSLNAVLWREGVILGEDGDISLERPTEAIAALEQAYDLAEGVASKDPNDWTSRNRVGSAGRELGDILRHRDPQRALAIYDHAILRLGEIANSAKARRDQSLVLAGSSYALRRLHRNSEAKQRIDAAIALLRETKDFPADRISPGGEVDTALRALADYQAGIGQPERAAGIYRELLDKVMASKPNPETDLRDANNLSAIYQALAGLDRRTHHPGQAKALDARRLELWRHWDRKLPDNPFVHRQLAAATRP